MYKILSAGIGIITAVFLLGCSGASTDSQEHIYDIFEINSETIQYPQVNFAEENDIKKEEAINTLILSTLYGPYQFLSDPELAVSVTYEITCHNEDYLSICYSGTYSDQSGYAGDVCYAVTIDLDHEAVAALEDIVGHGGIEEITAKIKNCEFETEYGAITPDNKYIDINSIIEKQPIISSDPTENRYSYFLRDKKIGIIITGLPRYGGNYSVIDIDYVWTK